MNDKIIWQLLDSLRPALGVEEALEAALVVLVWAKLSAAHQLPPLSRIDAAVAGGPGSLGDALTLIRSENGMLDRAFSNAARLVQIDPRLFRQAAELAISASRTGILDNLDAADAVVLSSPKNSELAKPAELVDLMVELCGLDTGDTLYVPWDFGAQFGVRAMRRHVNAYIETPSSLTIPLLVSLLDGGALPLEVHQTDPIRSPSAVVSGKPRQFDVSVAFPPLGIRYDPAVAEQDWFGRFPEKTHSGSVLAVRHLLAHASRRVVIAVPNSLLFSIGVERNLRENLLREGKLQAVIAMPAGLLSMTTIGFAVLILDPRGNRSSVRFVNADSGRFHAPSSKTKTRLINIAALRDLVLSDVEGDDAATVTNEALLANDAQLQVGRYVLARSEKQFQARLAEADTVPLGDLVTTVRPMPTAKDSNDCIEALEVGAADLPRFGYIVQPGRRVKVDPQTVLKSQHQFLKPYDIVLIVKGSVGKIGIVPANVPAAGDGGWIAGQSAIVLRMNDQQKLDPRTLALQLRSPLGQRLLDGIMSGAAIPMIQLRELVHLPVLLPSVETAAQAVAALEEEAATQQKIDLLQNQQAKIAADIWPLD